MTIPIERSVAVLRARDLLIELATKSNVDSRKALRERARSLLRHYPEPLHLRISSAWLPEIWADPGSKWQD
ncbi:hypothetical protein B0G81_2179 [Paraburkholderia sp. BL6665CI2N2]|nr:hypothetical protein B0G81_2179 [Paraburkholderia sp. BL6665CI2N2]